MCIFYSGLLSLSAQELTLLTHPLHVSCIMNILFRVFRDQSRLTTHIQKLSTLEQGPTLCLGDLEVGQDLHEAATQMKEGDGEELLVFPETETRSQRNALRADLMGTWQ